MAKVLVLSIALFCLFTASAAQVDHDYSGAHPPSPVPEEKRIDINHASLDELLKVPGLTRTWALRILRFRPYRSKQDLLDEGVIPGDVYSRIRDYLIAHQAKQ